MKRNLVLPLLLFLQTFLYAQVWLGHGSLPNTLTGSSQVTFSIGNKAYIYTGDSLTNFFEFDPVSGSWSPKTNFPGLPRNGAMGFSIGMYGYVGAGGSDSTTYHDFYRYDPSSDTWQVRASYPDTSIGALSFTANGNGYVVSGYNQDASSTVWPNWNFVYSNKCYEYNPTTNGWIQKNNIPWTPRMNGLAIGIGTKAYCGLGSQYLGGNYADWWEYNALTDTWIQKANCPVSALQSGFYNGTSICVADGNNWGLRTYSIGSNTWGSSSLYHEYCNTGNPLAGFSIGNRGFLVSHNGGGSVNVCPTLYDTWEFDPAKTLTLSSINGNTFCEGDDIVVSMNSNLVFDTANVFWLSWTTYPGSFAPESFSIVTGQQASSLTFRIPYSFISAIGELSANGYLTLNSLFPRTVTTLTNNFEVHNGPSSDMQSGTYNFCEGSAIVLSAGNYSGQTYQWSNISVGGIVISGNYVISATITNSTQLTLTTELVQSGCTRVDSIFLQVLPNPTVPVTDTIKKICYGQTASIGSLALTGWDYSWDIGSNSPQISVAPQNDSWFVLTVIDTETLCYSYYTFEVEVTTPPQQWICMVTVDPASNHNVIVWEKNDQEATDSFYLYREFITGTYQQIAAIHADSLSEYHDLTANPNVTGYRYRISVKDTCGNYSLYPSGYHNSMHLQYLGNGNLQWNAYYIEGVGSPVTSYDVVIDEQNTGNWQPLITVSGSQTTATDANFSQHPNAQYRVTANWPYTCTSSRSSYGSILSNIITQQSIGIHETNVADVSIVVYAGHQLVIHPTGCHVSQCNIYTSSGALVQSVNTAATPIEIGSFAQGVYLVEVVTDNGTVMKRIGKL